MLTLGIKIVGILKRVFASMNPNVERFAVNLKRKYKSRLINREKQWPIRQSSRLVRLQLVHRGEAEGSYTSIQRGKDDKRSPLAYCDLFKGESGKDEPVRKVLVEGGAGIGKTTLTISLSEDWACGKLFQEFELVLLLPLRQEEVASAGSLPELLKLLHSSPSVCESVSSYLEEEEAEKVLVIADGWDELSECKRRKGSFLYQFLFHKFPLMSVVVTSRPSASASLHRLPILDRFVDIKGFNNYYINEYIQSEFASDQEKAKRLLEQLEYNPLIESVCSVPLNCAIVCHLWDTLEEAFPSTMTLLYTRIVLYVTSRNLRKLPAYGPAFRMASFNDLPEGLQKSWWLLCEFAFKALEKDQIVFTKEELVEFLPEYNEQLLCFGLLQSVETVIDMTWVVSFHFLDLTFIEYLAALHLSRQPQDECIKCLQNHGKPMSSSMFLKFFCGICFSRLQSELEIDYNIVIQVTSQYFNQNLILCHCAFEAQNDFFLAKAIQFLIRKPQSNSDTFGNSHNPYDSAAILYVIAGIQECNGLMISFSHNSITEYQIRVLADVLSSKHGNVQVEHLSLNNNRLTDESISYLFSRASIAFQSLSFLALSGNTIQAGGITSLATALSKTPTEMSRLYLSNNPSLGVSGLRALENAVHEDTLSNLDLLHIEGSLTSDADTNALFLDGFGITLLGRCRHFQTLSLSCNNLGAPGAAALARVISSRSSSESASHPLVLYLNQTNLGDTGLCALVENRENVCYFKALYLRSNSVHATGIAFLADALLSQKIIIERCVDLSDNPLGVEGTKVVCRMLSSDKCQVDELILSRCMLGIPGDHPPQITSVSPTHNVPTFNEDVKLVGNRFFQVPPNRTITLLDLDGNSFSGNSIHVLAGLMYSCLSLECLKTCNCGINSDDLAKLLHLFDRQKFNLCIKKLSKWNLSSNKINDNGISTLIENLPSSLIDIDLENNPVSNETMERLEKKLKQNIIQVRKCVKQLFLRYCMYINTYAPGCTIQRYFKVQ